MAKKTTKKNEEFIWGGVHAFFYHPFVASFVPDLTGKVILDCGSGKGINAYLIKATRALDGATFIGLDVNSNYMSFTKRHNIYDKQIVNNLPKLPFKDKSIDFLLCSEVIEHLTKNQGQLLLSEIDRVCRGRAVVTTPNIFFKNPPGEKEDAHRSLWRSSDFRSAGYKVYGLGAKIVVGINDPLLKIKQAINYITTPISYLIPEISGYLLAVKDYS